MKILKGNYGECRFCDNMDAEHGLPSLEEKSWDLCLTDPPYNVGATTQKLKRFRNTKRKRVDYIDEIENYGVFSHKWFSQIKNKSKIILFTPGNYNLKWWFKFNEPKEILFHYISNSVAYTGHCNRNKFNPILVFGKLQGWIFTKNVFDIPINTLNKDLIHPHPKSLKLWYELISQTKPSSVIDPFLGSGTTAEVCESLGIPWLGYEIMEEYAPDIEKRIKRGIKKKQQESLEAFL